MIKIEAIEIDGLKTVITFSTKGKQKTENFSILQAGDFLSKIAGDTVSYKDKSVLESAAALQNAYRKVTRNVKIGPVEASVKIKAPDSSKKNIEITAASATKESEGNAPVDVSKTLEKLRKYAADKEQRQLKAEKEMMERYKKRLIAFVKKLAHMNGSDYIYERSVSNAGGIKETSESVKTKKSVDYTKFSVSELKKMGRKLSLSVRKKERMASLRLAEQYKRRSKLIEARYKALVENEEQLNSLLNAEERNFIDITEAYSPLEQDGGMRTIPAASLLKISKPDEVQRELFRPGTSALKTGDELKKTLKEIRTLFEEQAVLNEKGIDPQLADITSMSKYTQEVMTFYAKKLHNLSQRNYYLVQKYKKNNPEFSEYAETRRSLLKPKGIDYEKLDEKEKRRIEHIINTDIRNRLKSDGKLKDLTSPAPAEVESAEIRRINAKKELQTELEQAGKALQKVVQQKVADYIRSLPPKQKRELTPLDLKKIAKEISPKSLGTKFRSKAAISPKDTSQVRGLDSLFSPDETVSVVIYNKELPSKTKIVDYKDGYVAPEGWAVKTKTNGQPLVLKERNRRIFRKIRLKKITVPEWAVKDDIVDNYFSSVLAASFFQILVSNTPLDEEYDYETEEEEVRTRNKRLRGKDVDSSGKLVTIVKDEYDFADEVEVFTYKRKRKRHHKPDNDSVRYSWNLHYKGRTFTSKELGEKCTGCFDKKANSASIKAIAEYIHSKTKDSPVDNPNFTYDNSNRRWEQLEYGGYTSKNSGPFSGAKYGSLYQHGVTNGFSWQAPKGYVRAAEALWNTLAESDFMWSSIADFLNSSAIQLDVSKTRSELMQKLMKETPDIGTSEYDYKTIYLEKEV